MSRDVGEQQSSEGIHQSADERRAFARRDELVVHRDPSAVRENAVDFARDVLRIRDDRQQEVQRHRVEGVVVERQRPGVHHPGVDVVTGSVGAGLGSPNHRRRDVDGGHRDAVGNVREVRAGATADDQQSVTGLQREALDRSSAAAFERPRQDVVHRGVQSVPESIPAGSEGRHLVCTMWRRSGEDSPEWMVALFEWAH